MDEPFSALDVLTSETLRNEVIDIYTSKTSPVNSILRVTHSNEGGLEFFELARHVDLELSQLLLVVKAAELLGWARYAALFRYNSTARIFQGLPVSAALVNSPQ